MKKSIIVLKCVMLMLSGLALTSCWVSHEVKIDCDKKVDDRLAGVWKLVDFTEAERKELHEDDDGDVGWDYIIFTKVEGGRYKVIPLSETAELNDESTMLEYELGTKKHNGSNLMAASLTIATIKKLLREDGDGEEPNEKEIAEQKRGLILDYSLNEKGQLFLRYLAGEAEEAIKVHPIKFQQSEDKFFPQLILQGNQKEILDFYTDSKVKKLLSSLGKYQKLVVPRQ